MTKPCGFLMLLLAVNTCLALCENPVTLSTRTCQDIGPSCIPVLPGQSGTDYEFRPEHNVYFFKSLSGKDRYFLLMGDVQCEKSCFVMQFQDGSPSAEAKTTIDLNGHSIRYSAGSYPEMQNSGFESWNGNSPAAWTITSGSASPRSTRQWMPMTGDNVLYSPSAITLESPQLDLPYERVYFGYATLGKLGADVTLEVLNQQGAVVCSAKTMSQFLSRGQGIGCKFKGKGLHKLRIRAQGESYIDLAGIVPYNDYGIAVITSWSLSGSNTYQNQIVHNLQGLTVPGSGDHANPARLNHLEVKNGKIIAGSENLDSIGVIVEGTTDLHLHDVEVHTRGLKSHTFSGSGRIHGNYLNAQIPWYFQRENSDEENGLFWGGEYYGNLAVGGQGVLRLSGNSPKVYDNCLRNNAQATNHYAITHSGASDPEIYGNIFDPIEGSGILTYTGSGYRIYNNIFHVKTAPCNVEYINEDYSTNAIRMNDYGSGENRDNWVYNNTFYINGSYTATAWSNCMPVTTGIFYSAFGDSNRIFNNTFRIIKTSPSEMAPVFGIYIGSARNNPQDNRLITGNLFQTNDKAIWISSFYGNSQDLWLENNSFVRLENPFYTPASRESAIRMGYWQYGSPNIRLVNNRYDGFSPDSYHFTATSQAASYSIDKSHYINILVRSNGLPAQGVSVTAAGAETVSGTTGTDGRLALRVTEYRETGDMRPAGTHQRTMLSPYEIKAAGQSFGTVSADRELFLELDLGAGMAFCGDSACSASENCTACPADCGECCHEADTDCDRCVEAGELQSHIGRWKTGLASLKSLISAIIVWKAC